MKRREFIVLAGGAMAWPFAARAQQAKPQVIGYLSSGSPVGFGRFAAAFRQGLSEAGYIEGQNVHIEYRWAEGQFDRLPALAADLVRRRVAAIAATGGPTPALAAKAATATIPIVFTGGADPVAVGLVSNLGRPEGNITGFTSYSLRLEPKRLELLRELLPDVATIAFLINPGSASTELQLSGLRSAAQSVGVQAFELGVKSYDDIEAAFATAKEKHAGAIFVSSDAFFTNQRDRIVALAARHAVPAMYAFREFVSDGGLISYGASVADGYRQAGVYIGRILSGAKPADLPVQQPTKFELVINLRTAKALGLTIPPVLLARADEVIE